MFLETFIRANIPLIKKYVAFLQVLLILTFSANCSWFRVKKTHKVPINEQPLPAKTADLAELVRRVNESPLKVEALKLTVIYELMGGSINTGEISNYRETDGFILLRKPGMIRLIGEAFKVKVFDMVSDGKEFRIYVPPKNKFFQGLNGQEIRPKKDVPVSLRPQHIFNALVIEPLELKENQDQLVIEEEQEGKRKYYVLMQLRQSANHALQLERKIWIDRFDLNLVRQNIYENGQVQSEMIYSEFKEFSGGTYPAVINFKRPQEEYSLRIRISKATINGTLKDEQFALERPIGTELVDLAKNPDSP